MNVHLYEACWNRKNLPYLLISVSVLKVQYFHMASWLSWLERRPVTAEVDGSSPFWVVSDRFFIDHTINQFVVTEKVQWLFFKKYPCGFIVGTYWVVN